jgi:hypothetical protein
LIRALAEAAHFFSRPTANRERRGAQRPTPIGNPGLLPVVQKIKKECRNQEFVFEH